jgi:Putative adhesin
MTTIAPPPPAPATPPPQLSPGGRTATRVTLIVVAAVLVVGAVVSLVGTAWGVSAFRVITDSKPLPSAMRSLVVDTGSVPVAVRITTDREVREPRADLRMVNSTRANANPLAVTTDRADAKITISGEPTRFLQWVRGGQITIVLPPDLARRLTVTTQQKNGVVLAQADLDQLIARTDNGAIVLSGSARRIEVHTANGEIVTDDPISVTESFSAATDNGEITVDFSEAAPRMIDATSENGDIVVGLPAGGHYVVNASTDNGDTEVRVPRTSDRENAAAVVTIRSENGDVIIDDIR